MRQIVTLASPEFDKEAVELFDKLGFTILREVEELAIFVVEGDYLLSADDYGIIQEVHEDAPIKPMYVPNDTYYSSQSYLQKLNLESAWDRATGANVVIADCNSGVSSGVSEFSGQLLTGWNVVAGNTTVTPDSGVSHGNLCAGIIIALSNNSAGITGVAFNAQLLPIRMDTPGLGGSAYPSDIIAAITYAANQSNVSIINVSYLLMETYSIFASVITYAAAQGKLVVICAGNDTTVISNPSPEGLVVSSIGNSYGYSSFSNYGAAVDITAVGESIYSTTGVGGYAFGSGTSFSTPQVAGIAALIKGIYPQYNPYDLKAILIASANRNPTGSSWGTGRNDHVGAGLADAMAALNTSYSKSWVRRSYKNPVALIDTLLNGELMLAGVNTTVTLTTKAIHASIVSRAFSIDGVDQGTTFTGDSTSVTLNLAAGTHTLALTATDSVGGVTTVTNTVYAIAATNLAGTATSIPSRVPAGKTLQVRVRAKNVSGTSAWTSWTNVNSATSVVLPNAPKLAEVNNNGTNAELYHERMSNATGYQYSINGGTPVTALGYPIVIARTGAAQTVTVEAVYASGAGIPTQGYTIDPAPVVSDLTTSNIVAGPPVTLEVVSSATIGTSSITGVTQFEALAIPSVTQSSASTVGSVEQSHTLGAVGSTQTAAASSNPVAQAQTLVVVTAAQTPASAASAVTQAQPLEAVACTTTGSCAVSSVSQVHTVSAGTNTKPSVGTSPGVSQAQNLEVATSSLTNTSSELSITVGAATILGAVASSTVGTSTVLGLSQIQIVGAATDVMTNTSSSPSVSQVHNVGADTCASIATDSAAPVTQVQGLAVLSCNTASTSSVFAVNAATLALASVPSTCSNVSGDSAVAQQQTLAGVSSLFAASSLSPSVAQAILLTCPGVEADRVSTTLSIIRSHTLTVDNSTWSYSSRVGNIFTGLLVADARYEVYLTKRIFEV